MPRERSRKARTNASSLSLDNEATVGCLSFGLVIFAVFLPAVVRVGTPVLGIVHGWE